MKTYYDYQREAEQEKQRAENEFDLKEMAHYYGGWNELRKVIDELEAEDKVSAAERAYRN
jgi:hypothetical protein